MKIEQVVHLDQVPVASYFRGAIHRLMFMPRYQDSYLSFGFTCIEPGNREFRKCVVCGEKISNEYLAPSKLKRHLKMKHSQDNKITKTSEKALVTSYKVAEIIARNLQPHTAVETLILLACIEIVKTMPGEAAEREISKVSLSNDSLLLLAA